MRQTTLNCLALASTLLVALFFDTPVEAAETKTLWVAHHRVDCIGVAPQKCYLIKNTQYEDWRFWYGEIEGFDYEEGYAYEIRVREIEVENPPADASAIRLELVEVILKVETFDTPDPPTAPSPIVPTEPVVAEDLPLAPESPAATIPPPAPPRPAMTPTVESAQRSPDPTPPASSTPPPAPIPEPSGSGRMYRGHLTIGAGVEARSFKLCGAETSLWVEDRTASDLWGLYRRLSSYPNRPVFMEVTAEVTDAPAGGFGAHFQQQILIQEVRNASVESAGCFAEPASFAFQASGNEPFWNVEISRRGLVFSELGSEARILFPYSPPTFFGEQIIYRSQIRGQEPRELTVRLEQEACNDSMADATSNFSARVKIDDRELEGCARQGEEEP